jgi:hypothetical protein
MGTLPYQMPMVDLSESTRLVEMLQSAGIKFDYIPTPEFGGVTIRVPSTAQWEAHRGISIIQHFGSYGGQSGRLECWCKTKMLREKEPVGWLSAYEVFEKVQKALGIVAEPLDMEVIE